MSALEDNSCKELCTQAESSTSEAVEQNEKVVSQDQGVKGFTLYACMGSLTLALFLSALDILIVSTIIETVSRDFNEYSKSGWLVTGYSLPTALLSLVWGRTASIIGFKSSMLLSIIIFEVGSLVSALANSMNMLIGGRVISGVGGSGLQTLCFLIISTLVDERSRGMAIAVLSCSFAVASIVGPFLGGAFTTHVTWRWCFYINLPIGGLAFLVFVLSYNPNGGNSIKNFTKAVRSISHVDFGSLLKAKSYYNTFEKLVFKFDFVGFALCSAGFCLILLGLTFGGNEYSWGSGTIIAYLVIGIVLSIAFFLYDFFVFNRFKAPRENTVYRPLVSWNVLSKPGVITATAVNFTICLMYNAQVIYIVQFFQLIYGSTAWKAGVHLIACVIPTIITVNISGIINGKTGHVKFIIVVGVLAAIVGAGLLTLLDNNSGSSKHIGLLILPGIAFGAIIQSTLMSSQIQIDKSSPSFRHDFISVTTMNSFAKALGTAFGGVISNTVFTTSVHNKLVESHLNLPIGSSASQLIVYRAQNFDGPKSTVGYILSDSIKNVFWMALGFSAVALIFGILCSNKKIDIRKPGTDQAETEVTKDEEAEQTPKI